MVPQQVVLTGKDVEPGGLWIIPIDGRANLDEEEPKQEQNPPNIAAATVYTLSYKQQKVKYMHQTFFAMPPTTLEKVISNNQLKGFPMMNTKDIRKHLPPSPATPKGRMKRPRGGIRSTRRERKDEFEKELEEQLVLDKGMHPPAGSTTSEGVPTNNNEFCFVVLTEKGKGTLYMDDATCALPVMSLNGHQYYIVAYDYGNNFIEAKEVSDLKDETIVEAVQKIFDKMEAHGHRLLLNVTDNQAAQPLKTFLKTKECKWQFIEPHNHRVNTAERAIQIFKNHLIRVFLLHRQQVATAVMEQPDKTSTDNIEFMPNKLFMDKDMIGINIQCNRLGREL